MFDIKKKNFKNTWAIGLVRPTIWVHIKIMIQQLIIFWVFSCFFILSLAFCFYYFPLIITKQSKNTIAQLHICKSKIKKSKSAKSISSPSSHGIDVPISNLFSILTILQINKIYFINPNQNLLIKQTGEKY